MTATGLPAPTTLPEFARDRVGTVRSGLTVRFVKVTESVWHEQIRAGGEWVFRREWSNAAMDAG